MYRLDPSSGAATVVADDFVRPNGLAFCADERRLFIADTDNHRIRAVDPATGVITTVAGNGTAGFGGDGGDPTAASLQRPWGVALDAAGNLFIADTFNNRIRMVTR